MLVILPEYFVIKLPFCRSSFVENEKLGLLHLSVNITRRWVHGKTFRVNLCLPNITISLQNKFMRTHNIIAFPAYTPYTTNFVKSLYIYVCIHNLCKYRCM